jgi:hypothetical protein
MAKVDWKQQILDREFCDCVIAERDDEEIAANKCLDCGKKLNTLLNSCKEKRKKLTLTKKQK